jgi:hypothetical protein
VTHEIDQTEVGNAMMELQEVVLVVQSEVHVQDVQGKHAYKPWSVRF